MQRFRYRPAAIHVVPVCCYFYLIWGPVFGGIANPFARRIAPCVGIYCGVEGCSRISPVFPRGLADASSRPISPHAVPHVQVCKWPAAVLAQVPSGFDGGRVASRPAASRWRGGYSHRREAGQQWRDGQCCCRVPHCHSCASTGGLGGGGGPAAAHRGGLFHPRHARALREAVPVG